MVKNILSIVLLVLAIMAVVLRFYLFGYQIAEEDYLEEQEELQEEIQLLEEKNYDLTDQVWSLTNYIEKEMSE